MKYRADLHIHTLLSPCASLEMTPRNIIRQARMHGIDIIGITDHNSTLNAQVVKSTGDQEGIFILTGAEVTTREEVHCLVFFESPDNLERFQQFIDRRIVKIPDPAGVMGYQPVIDAAENIVEMIPYYLPAALDADIYEVQQVAASLDGLFIPAHVDRRANGLFHQLGFIPPGLSFDALGISPHACEKHVAEHYVMQHKTTLIRNSDAHYLKQIGEIYTLFELKEISFAEIRKALHRQENRYCELP